MISKSLQKIIGGAILEYNIQKNFDLFSEDQKRKIVMYTPIEFLNNSILSEYVSVFFEYDVINRLNNRRFTSLMIRLYDMGQLDGIKTCVELYDQKRISIDTLRLLISRNPEFFCPLMDISLDSLGHSDAVSLLRLGNYFLFKSININKYDLSTSESFEIVKSFGFNRDVLLKMTPDKFDAFDTREILMHSSEVVDLLNLKQLNAQNWRDVLLYQPSLADLVNISEFRDSNITDLIELCVAANHGYEILFERDMNEISGYGWELLLISKPNLFVDVCDISKLEYSNKISILTHRPELRSIIILD